MTIFRVIDVPYAAGWLIGSYLAHATSRIW